MYGVMLKKCGAKHLRCGETLLFFRLWIYLHFVVNTRGFETLKFLVFPSACSNTHGEPRQGQGSDRLRLEGPGVPVAWLEYRARRRHTHVKVHPASAQPVGPGMREHARPQQDARMRQPCWAPPTQNLDWPRAGRAGRSTRPRLVMPGAVAVATHAAVRPLQKTAGRDLQE